MSKIHAKQVLGAITGDSAASLELVVRFSEPVENTSFRGNASESEEMSAGGDVFIRYVFTSRRDREIFRRGMMCAGAYANFEILSKQESEILDDPSSMIDVETVVIEDGTQLIGETVHFRDANISPEPAELPQMDLTAKKIRKLFFPQLVFQNGSEQTEVLRFDVFASPLPEAEHAAFYAGRETVAVLRRGTTELAIRSNGYLRVSLDDQCYPAELDRIAGDTSARLEDNAFELFCDAEAARELRKRRLLDRHIGQLNELEMFDRCNGFTIYTREAVAPADDEWTSTGITGSHYSEAVQKAIALLEEKS